MQAMSASQNHGFEIEQRLISEFPRRNPNLVMPTMDMTRGYTARFDVPGYLDPFGRGVPTSIKASHFRGPRTLVCLADALRTVALGNEERLRLMVALYRQDKDQKLVEELREYEILGSEWNQMCGHVPPDQIEAFANDLKHGTHHEARVRAKEWQKNLAALYPSRMRWNPKIDSVRQRRLQCSISLQDIEASIQDPRRIRVYGREMGDRPRPGYLKAQSERLWGRGLHFPMVLDSPARSRKPKKVEEVASSPELNGAENSLSAPSASVPDESQKVARVPLALTRARMR